MVGKLNAKVWLNRNRDNLQGLLAGLNFEMLEITGV